MEISEKTKFKISVRHLVEFMLRSGSIDNRVRVASPESMQEGSRIHRMIQRRMGAGYRAEVPLKYTLDAGEYEIEVEGRADGIFEESYENLAEQMRMEAMRLGRNLEPAVAVMEAGADERCMVIDEIKGVHRDVDRMSEAAGVHLAQAKCYGAICAINGSGSPKLGIQMTYCNIASEEIRRFTEIFDAGELIKWFDELMEGYKKWTDFRYKWQRISRESIKQLDFPFEYRSGQKELAAQVYRTIYHKKRLFLEAPTGVGKTVSTLFPAVKALGEGRGEMIFYLTAKTTTAAVAGETFEIMRGKGLRLKTAALTAKEKLCPLEKPDCNPESCPYADGHYDRINDAMYELLTSSDSFSRDAIRAQSEKRMVCPYELSLDMSLFADAVIGDYNYVFDPNVALKRFFAESINGEYIFLVDEAHNLVERAREMYSADIYKEELLEIRKLIKPYFKPLEKSLAVCNRIMLDYKKDDTIPLRHGAAKVRRGADELILALTRAAGYLDEFMDDERSAPLREELLDFYFELRHFLNISELLDENYVIYTDYDDQDRFFLRLCCVNPKENLRQRLDKGIATVFFSATLLPVTYYMDLLSGDRKDYAVYAPSPFDPSARGVFLATDVSSRYKRRGYEEYRRIAAYINDIVLKQAGNYMVFFPSYRFLQDVYEVFSEDYPSPPYEVLCQSQTMREDERALFLERFYSAGSSLVGFCVLGGIFSEGIDLREDSLIGAIIVGTGLPQVGTRLDILRDYFDRKMEGRRGFDYAYRIPGMNKVLQSAGRVIRTDKDRGVVVLLDERFALGDYRGMFPKEWEDIQVGEKQFLLEKLEDFWHYRKL